MNKIHTIYLDLDGVFVDLQSKICEVFGEGTQYGDIPSKQFWAEMEKIPNVFLHLDQIPGSRRVFQYIESIQSVYNVEVAILTSIPIPTGSLRTAREDKIKWVRRNLSETIPVITVLGGSKKADYANPNSLLIDDLERNVMTFREDGGNAILHRSTAETCIRLLSMFPDESL